ncbi:MAG: glycosyltransferase [Ignavibacteriales bacterium]|nr:glycosyltransferase [Ignavibacteriales bacterium]
MKIAFIVNQFPSLSQTFILNQITGLIDLGCDVQIFASTNSNDKQVHSDVKKYNLMEKVNYLTFPNSKIKRFSEAVYLITINVYKNPFKILKALNIFKYGKKASSLSLLYILIPFLNKKYDILQCHFGSNGNMGAFLKQIGIEGKLVTMFHGYDIREGAEKGKEIYKQIINYGDCFLAISDYNYKNLVRFGFDKEKIIFHPVGIEIDKFPFKWQEKSKISTPIVVLTVARLVEEKGLKYSIMAINEILKKNPYLALRYYIIGEGPLKESLKKLIRELELGDVIKCLGAMNQVEVAKEMVKAHIFLLPSIAEALPLVLMEAQAIGLPAIATNVGSVDEVVIDQKSGFIVPARDVDALAKKLEYLIEHPGLWPKMGRYGRKFIEENYNIKKLNQRLLEIYQNLIEEKHE